MMRRAVLGFVLAACLAVPVLATERSEVPAKYKWDLKDLYPSESAWNAARDAIAKRIPQMARYQGRLGASAESLAIGLGAVMKLNQDFQRLYTYASQLSDEDIRVSRHLAMKEGAEKLNVDLNAATAFVQPEILSIGATKVRSFLASEPRLRDYRHYLETSFGRRRIR